MKKSLVKSSALVVGAFTAGGVVGYFFAKNRLESLYRGIADEEIASVKDVYKRLRKGAEYSDPALAVEELIAPEIVAVYEHTLAELEYVEPVEHEDTPDELDELGHASGKKRKKVAHNVFTDSETKEVVRNVFDTAEKYSEEELSAMAEEADVESVIERDPDIPYVISVAEFMANDDEFDQISITYFDGDDTLADEREQIIPDIENVVGAANLQKFGENGSNDKDVVYIRNERIHTDFEVCREDGKYAVMVLGISEELLDDERPAKPRVRKMREDD